MRRKISLYIGGELADLDDESFILFNYTMDDLSNPTIVKNSFSQQVSLPGTPNNNAIFGDYYRLDRKTALASGETGYAFNASVKTPFSIYNELGEIIESGYCKLDSVVRNKGAVSYKVSLYGGLGSFFYSLSYAEDGRKLTLADLDFLGNGDPGELDFTINASAVQDAWDRLYGDTSKPEMWDVLNFAPAYNGYPDNFSPDKGLVQPGGIGLPSSVGGYTTKSGYALVNLANKQDEWAVKDLRSYLQRPILSVNAFLDAISDPNNNGGYQVDIQGVTSLIDGMWITLPTIPSLGSMKQNVGTLSLSMSTSATSGNNIGRWDITGDTIPYGSMVYATIKAKVRFNMPGGADSYATLDTYASDTNNRNADNSVIILQMVAYGSDNSVVGGSAAKVVCSSRATAPSPSSLGLTLSFATSEYDEVSVETASKISSGIFELDKEFAFQVVAQDAAYYILQCFVFDCHSVRGRDVWQHNYSGNGSTCQATLFHSYTTKFQANSGYIVNGSGNSVSMTASDTLRSNARITKQMLLSSSQTPADYLLSFCKIFGLYFIADTATKKVTILPRNDLYLDETIDLTERVDISNEVEIVPMVCDSKWYKFALEGVGGAFFDEYKDIEGIEYGVQMVNTGFDFNAEVKDLLDGNVFKNAVSILQNSRYWNIITNGAYFIPSPFLDTGNTITRWNASDETQETQVSCPPSSATITYYNNAFNGYDADNAMKMQFADADGKPIDGRDVLVYLNGFESYSSFKLTDDLPIMGAVNEGKPCWILDEGAGLDIPCFSRYIGLHPHGDLEIFNSLDFGMPRQLDIPGIYYREGVTIYDIAWKAYIADRYDVDTEVMRCRVDFRGIGIQVGNGLLRRFYYYDGSLWVLNKITNYSMTTYDPVECEFIRVQDKDNYLTGQTY